MRNWWIWLAILILCAGLVLLVRAILYPSGNFADLTAGERYGYGSRSSSTLASASSTASSTDSGPSCAGFTAKDCPAERWQTYRDPQGRFEIGYPLPENLKNQGNGILIDTGYPNGFRVTVRTLDGPLGTVMQSITDSSAYGNSGSRISRPTFSGHSAVVYHEAEEEFGPLIFMEQDRDTTLFFYAEFTEDFEADQDLYGRILRTLRFPS